LSNYNELQLIARFVTSYTTAILGKEQVCDIALLFIMLPILVKLPFLLGVPWPHQPYFLPAFSIPCSALPIYQELLQNDLISQFCFIYLSLMRVMVS